MRQQDQRRQQPGEHKSDFPAISLVSAQTHSFKSPTISPTFRSEAAPISTSPPPCLNVTPDISTPPAHKCFGGVSIPLLFIKYPPCLAVDPRCILFSSCNPLTRSSVQHLTSGASLILPSQVQTPQNEMPC